MELRANEKNGDLWVEISGEMNFKDHIAFNDFINNLQGKNFKVTFDLSRLETIDSAGIGMFFLAQKVIEKDHGSIKLVNPQGQVKRVFEITGMNSQISISEDKNG